jgi:hypothetical protein
MVKHFQFEVMDSINTTPGCCVCSRFTKQSSRKTPHIYRYNGGNPTIGNVRWVLSQPPKVEIGRVCEECRNRNERALQVRTRIYQRCYFNQ